MVPSAAMLELAGVVVIDALIAVGITIVFVWLGPKQPLLSLTATVCEPVLRLLKVAGEVQGANEPLSRLHS
jgi:hypothetical protein